ncbi:MAG: hypothetical protein ABI724_01330 [Betaproteobacteria bacterium]
MERVSPIDDGTELDGISARDLLSSTLRFNTLIFGVILGVFAGASLLALALIASATDRFGHLAVVLIGVFLPGYSADGQGALIGFLWGFVFGAALGGVIYRINSLRVLSQLEQLVVAQPPADGFRGAVLRLHGPSLGTAIGAVGAVGLIATTNLLVARGTAGASPRARLLAEVLPGYSVSPVGSIIGAIGLFVVLYLFCQAFVAIYNSLAGWRKRG